MGYLSGLGRLGSYLGLEPQLEVWRLGVLVSAEIKGEEGARRSFSEIEDATVVAAGAFTHFLAL